MKKTSTNTVFYLLRSALCHEAVVGELPSDIDWLEVIDLAFEQGVAAVAVDGWQRGLELNAESQELALDSPELEDLKYEWFEEVFQAEEDYQKYKSVIEHLANILSSHNQKLLLLKGYALSQIYPIPEHRCLGDIDIKECRMLHPIQNSAETLNFVVNLPHM